MKSLLGFVKTCNSSVVYGAVDKRKLSDKLYSSADPVNMCFRMCMQGIEEWVAKNHSGELALIIMDDCDKDIKKILRASFKGLRNQVWQADTKKCDWIFHDDMYFGSSADSVGIQLADLCGFFIAKHLKQESAEAEGFYEMIKDRIVYEKVEPD